VLDDVQDDTYSVLIVVPEVSFCGLCMILLNSEGFFLVSSGGVIDDFKLRVDFWPVTIETTKGLCS
jgi:hypothetical protein